MCRGSFGISCFESEYSGRWQPSALIASLLLICPGLGRKATLPAGLKAQFASRADHKSDDSFLLHGVANQMTLGPGHIVLPY
ncbi:hypothetical protein BDR05DRAFT_536991 [Suillus weaverae]|nr:hypothetical protein BDR05DRAFT_536991 [Suillus weaverae]